MPEAGEARILDGCQAATQDVGPIEREHPQPAAAKVCLHHQCVVAGTNNDPVILILHCT